MFDDFDTQIQSDELVPDGYEKSAQQNGDRTMTTNQQRMVIGLFAMEVDWDKFSDGWASGSMVCEHCGKVFDGVRFRYSCHDKVEGDWPKCCNRFTKFRNDWKPESVDVMTKLTRFITRSQSEVRHHDLMMGNVAPLSKSMYREYVDSEYPQCGPAHVFIAEGLMYARGTKEQKAFAFGFYRSWIKAVLVRR